MTLSKLVLMHVKLVSQLPPSPELYVAGTAMLNHTGRIQYFGTEFGLTWVDRELVLLQI